jgi:hypothetical protein
MNLRMTAFVSAFLGVMLMLMHQTAVRSIVRHVREPFAYNNLMNDLSIYLFVGIALILFSIVLLIANKVKRKK